MGKDEVEVDIDKLRKSLTTQAGPLNSIEEEAKASVKDSMPALTSITQTANESAAIKEIPSKGKQRNLNIQVSGSGDSQTSKRKVNYFILAKSPREISQGQQSRFKEDS